VRSFVRGEGGKVGALIQRLYGSDDLFPDRLEETCRPHQSVNFITAHDGFCLYDLVAYDHKHNEANGHGNTDGTDDNRSWNCGVEGDSQPARRGAHLAPAASEELLRAAAARQRHPDDRRRRRIPQHAARQQ
jgi:pullulanase/glycogen debranching enzyme